MKVLGVNFFLKHSVEVGITDSVAAFRSSPDAPALGHVGGRPHLTTCSVVYLRNPLLHGFMLYLIKSKGLYVK